MQTVLKHPVQILFILVFLLGACAHSNNVVNNRSIQKRKFNRGFHFSSVSIKKSKSQNEGKTQDVKKVEQQTWIEPKSIDTMDILSWSTDEAMDSSVMALSWVEEKVEDQPKPFVDEVREAFVVQNVHPAQPTVHLSMEKILKTKTFKRTDQKTEKPKSREYKTFEVMHWILAGLASIFVLAAVVAYVVSLEAVLPLLFFLYVSIMILSFVQLGKLAKQVPDRDKGIRFKLKVYFARFLMIFTLVLSGILLLISGIFLLGEFYY